MSEDRSLFGDGRYPETGLLAVGARLGFLGAIIAIAIAVFLPSDVVPDFVHSPHLQHFAAFYTALLFGLAAMARARLRTLVTAYVVFATVLEAAHLIAGAPVWELLDNWVADMGGYAAAVAPVVVERFRRRFPRNRPK